MIAFWISTLGLTLVLQSKLASAVICSTEPEFHNACKFGNMSLMTLKGLNLQRENCDNIVLNISHLAAPPLISLTWPNRSELFTVVMLDAGQNINAPFYLQWLVTNCTADQLYRLSFSPNTILAQYESPSIPKTQRSPEYFQIVVFRQNSTLRYPMPEVHPNHRRNFSLRKWLIGAQDSVRLCGPVAGYQLRSIFNTTASRPTNTPQTFHYPGPVNYNNAPYYPPPQQNQGAYNPPPQGNPPGWAPPQPGWVPQGNQGHTSWASSGGNAQQTPNKKNHGTALKPQVFMIFTILITSVIGYATY